MADGVRFELTAGSVLSAFGGPMLTEDLEDLADRLWRQSEGVAAVRESIYSIAETSIGRFIGYICRCCRRDSSNRFPHLSALWR
jgi:hypothetical protein